MVITGGGRGIGEEAVKKFLRLGMRVIIGCRSPDRVQAKFEQEISEGKLPGTAECLYLDLSSLASVRTFAEAVIALNTPIHVLANNAGRDWDWQDAVTCDFYHVKESCSGLAK